MAGKRTRAKKTLPEREAELRTMLATAEGRAELEGLASQYAAAAAEGVDEPNPLRIGHGYRTGGEFSR